MVIADLFKILLGKKTEAELTAEQKWREAVESHKGTNGSVQKLAEKLHRARTDVHARIDTIATGGSSIDGLEAKENL